MLDLRLIRANPDLVKEAMAKRGVEVPIDELLELDAQRRSLLTELEQKKAQRNSVSEKIGHLRKAKENADHLIAEMKELSEEIKEGDNQLRELEQKIRDILLIIPNIPHSSVPVGKDDSDNVEVRRWGEIREFPFEPKPHWDLGVELDIIDFERAAKVTGARFAFMKGLGARLERAVINFMLDLHINEHGYLEVLPPYIANGDSMTGTGQLPKFGEDMFKLEGEDYYLIPTAEVPVTNYYKGEILEASQLPIYMVGFSPCFRAEAGSAGRDTRGLVRMHQFHKVELVKFAHPDNSYDELEKLTANAEEVLRRLGLPHRVVTLCTGDTGVPSAKTYDIEVWMPSYGRYVEISSCSNFEAFQARRAEIRFRPEPGAKPEYVHTLNGSGVAVGRTVDAILENYQEADGSVIVPEVLRPYMGGVERITRAK
ncbi:MAG: serine--tRNA ligase [Firmicutes bacterium]|nr:serine--tRNA ligase [Bacillota bacterium]